MKELGIGLMAAAGLVLMAGGSPVGRRFHLIDRVHPYLVRGSHTWNSRRRASAGTGMARAWVKFGPSDDRLLSRLKGARSDLDTAAFRIQQLVWGAAGLVCVLVLVMTAGRVGLQTEAGGVVVLGGIAFVSGFCGRDWFLSREIESRAQRVTEELPLAIDLMTLTLMAGGSVPVACERVARALPEGIGRDLLDALEDMRGGRSAITALRDVAAGVDHPPFVRLVEALCIGLDRGTPLAEVLRAQAHDIRDERRRRLIEVGGRREVMMLVPVVFLILPTVVLFALWPALISLDLLVP